MHDEPSHQSSVLRYRVHHFSEFHTSLKLSPISLLGTHPYPIREVDLLGSHQQNLTCYECVHSVAHAQMRSEEHTSELQSRGHLVCRLLLEKKNTDNIIN